MPDDGRSFYVRVGGLIAVCTLLLTASFVGVLAVTTNGLAGISNRVPWYILVAAIVFVGTIVLLEREQIEGSTIITTAFFVSLFGSGIVLLAVEGVQFTLDNPDLVFGSQLVLYFLAAGLVGTGVGYWAINHWREFSGTQSGGQL